MPATSIPHRSIRYLLVFVGLAVVAMTPAVADAAVPDRAARYVPCPVPTDDPGRYEGPQARPVPVPLRGSRPEWPGRHPP
jgi:hypothetical protein